MLCARAFAAARSGLRVHDRRIDFLDGRDDVPRILLGKLRIDPDGCKPVGDVNRSRASLRSVADGLPAWRGKRRPSRMRRTFILNDGIEGKNI